MDGETIYEYLPLSFSVCRGIIFAVVTVAVVGQDVSDLDNFRVFVYVYIYI